jgi:hypothetical protein
MKVSEQGRGRLVPVKRHATDKTRGRGRPGPILEPAVVSSTELHLIRRSAECSCKSINDSELRGSVIHPGESSCHQTRGN